MKAAWRKRGGGIVAKAEMAAKRWLKAKLAASAWTKAKKMKWRKLA
jgi:hypothetical protein